MVLGSAAVLSVYTAGFLKTRAAAERFARADAERPQPVPAEVRQAATSMAADLLARLVDSTPAVATTKAAPKPAPVDSHTTEAPLPKAAVPAAPRKAAAVVAKTAPDTPDVARPIAAKKVDSAVPAVTTSLVAADTKPVPSAPVPPVPTDSTATSATDSAIAVDSGPTRGPYKDGRFRGLGRSRHGEIEIAVEVENGFITSARITGCYTRWSCSWVDHLQRQVVERQSAEVDYVSGATQSGNAFYFAAVDALSKAK